MYDCLGANTPNPGIRSGDRGDEKENVYREEGLCLQMVLENDFRFGLQCQRILSRLAVCLKHHAALRVSSAESPWTVASVRRLNYIH